MLKYKKYKNRETGEIEYFFYDKKKKEVFLKPPRIRTNGLLAESLVPIIPFDGFNEKWEEVRKKRR